MTKQALMKGEQEADRDQNEYEWWREKTNTSRLDIICIYI
jgi:hypothetical protein